ncbi:hypothetical protein HBH61_048080 [Parastagonospora nodorum]|nr:hypothetical protein HBI05_158890 [Parastagonospora nodorum]KAH4817577.1 hypothetical protein HBH61_048080 [Parastagonospora nodorum]
MRLVLLGRASRKASSTKGRRLDGAKDDKNALGLLVAIVVEELVVFAKLVVEGFEQADAGSRPSRAATAGRARRGGSEAARAPAPVRVSSEETPVSYPKAFFSPFSCQYFTATSKSKDSAEYAKILSERV